MELDPKLVSRFEKWLRGRGYADRTIAKYTRDLVTCARNDGDPPSAKQRRKRIIDYVLACNVFVSSKIAPLPFEMPVVPEFERFGGKKSRDPKRVYEAVSFPREDYVRIVDAAAALATVPALVLVVVARTGIRISDVLRAPLGDLRRAMEREDGLVTLTVKGNERENFTLKNGGAAEKAWLALLAHPDVKRAPNTWHLAAAMMGDVDARAESQYGAYERVRVTLREIGESVKASGRVHIHRFRRSVGVYLAEGGHSEDQIQKIFGQKKGSQATKRYIDEARTIQSAKLLRSIE